MINIQILKDKYNTDRFEHIKAAGARDAAVLIPLIEDGSGRLSVLFEVRSSNIRQGGETRLWKTFSYEDFKSRV